MTQEPEENSTLHNLKEKISGLGQKIIGEIEEIGGALTGDPTTVAEGEFNVRTGEIREELEDAGLTESSESSDQP